MQRVDNGNREPAPVRARVNDAPRAEAALVLLRVSLGLLVFWWGIDKIRNVEHAVAVSENFYLGLFSNPLLLQIWGVAQTVVGVLYILGRARRWVYPAVLLINTVSMLAVWRSIVDPWGLVLDRTNVFFFPSLTIFAGCLFIWLREIERPGDGR